VHSAVVILSPHNPLEDQKGAGEAATDLPKARAVVNLLDAFVDETAPAREGKVIEDHFWIERVETGKLWLNPLTAGDSVIGPVPVAGKLTELCKLMWEISGVVAKTGQG
jgi:hypothetical protein